MIHMVSLGVSFVSKMGSDSGNAARCGRRGGRHCGNSALVRGNTCPGHNGFLEFLGFLGNVLL